jgi:hypothetical protein
MRSAMADQKDKSKPVHPSSAAWDLLLAMGRDRALRIAEQGIKALEADFGAGWHTSGDLWASVSKRRPQIFEEVTQQLGTDKTASVAAMEAADFGQEQVAPAQGTYLEVTGRERGPWSIVLRDSMRTLRDRARAAGEDRWTLGPLLSESLKHPDSLAAKVFRQQGASDPSLEAASQWLNLLPDPPEERPGIEGIVSEMQDLRYKLISSIRKEQESKTGGMRTLRDAYEQEPDRYAAQPDLPAELKRPPQDPRYEWAQRSGAVRQAARWQALSRKAPQVTLMHLLLALLVDGTDTSRFMDDRGVDRQQMRDRCDAACERFAEGPMFPEDSPQFALTHADKPFAPRKFSDLEYVYALLEHDRDPAAQLLASEGVERDDVRFSLHAIWTGDPEWHLKKPDLALELKKTADNPPGTSYLRAEALRRAAQYEARVRGSETVEPDHLLISLLTEGTDTSRFVRSKGLEPVRLAEGIDALLPRRESGPVFPKSSFGAHVQTSSFGKEPFTDLLALSDLLTWTALESEPAQAWVAILSGAGITKAAVDDALPPMRDTVDEYRRLRLSERPKREADGESSG